MVSDSRERLARLVRRSDCDLAEAALLICREVEPDLDVEVELLRLDAIADGLRVRGFRSTDPLADALALADYLGGERGFRGHAPTDRDPADGLLTRVLDRRRGLPITLSIVYVAIARRLRVPAFGVGIPGHFCVGIAGEERPVIVDAFHGGRILDESGLAELVRITTDGRLPFRRSMLRPAPPPLVIRRILNNLTRDFVEQGDSEDALWTVELKLLLPSALPDDHRVRGDLLVQLGRYDEAAQAFEAYLENSSPEVSDAEEIRRRAVRARAKLN